jgi:hypothetical protein
LGRKKNADLEFGKNLRFSTTTNHIKERLSVNFLNFRKKSYLQILNFRKKSEIELDRRVKCEEEEEEKSGVLLFMILVVGVKK